MLLGEARGALLASREARLVLLRESLRGDMEGSAAAPAPAPAPAALRRGDTAASSGTAARLLLLLPLARSRGEGAAAAAPALACSLLLVRERRGGRAAAPAELLRSLLLALRRGERSRGLETVAAAEASEAAEGTGVEEPLSCCLPPFLPAEPPSASLLRPATADLAAAACLRRRVMAA